MKRTSICILALLCAANIAAAQVPAPPALPGGEAPAPPPPDLTRPIQTLIDNAQLPSSLEINARTYGVDAGTAGVVYGDGVVIFDGRVQGRATPDQIRDLLRAFDKAGFGSMSIRLGGVPIPKGSMSAIRMISQVGIITPSGAKGVTQLEGGDQSAVFAKLVSDTTEFCRVAALGGVTAASVTDGLDKLLAGKLAPAAFDLRVEHVVDGNQSSARDHSFRLDIQGNSVDFSTDHLTGKDTIVHGRLLPAEFHRALAIVKANDPAGLPDRLYAPHNTDVGITVLDQDKSLQAREDFEGIGPTTLGDKQKQFNAMYEQIVSLYNDISNRICPLPAPGTAHR